MLTNQQQRIVVSIWEGLDDDEPSVSTERLFAMTSQAASDQLGITVDDGDVSEALAKFAPQVNRK